MTRFVALVLVALALVFRLPNASTHATFSYDQVQDLSEVERMVTTRTPALLGPIVRGELGGFYLGPWYYYLLAPFVMIFGPSPLVPAMVALALDLLLVLLLYLFILPRFGPYAAFALALIAACSPLMIQNSYTAWNVSLIPLWTLAIISSWQKHPFSLVFCASLATSIHASLFPLSIVALLTSWRLFSNRSPREYLKLALCAVIPVLPLIIYDCTHRFANLHLLKFFITHNAHGLVSYWQSALVVFEKTGYTVARLFVGEPFTWLGLVSILALVGYGYSFRRGSSTIRICLLLFGSLILSLVYYRRLDFAEYYLAAAIIPLLLLLSHLISHFPRPTWLITPLLVLYLSLGLHTLQQPASPYSLGQKEQVSSRLASLGYPVEVRYTLAPASRVGLDYLVNYHRLSTPGASYKALIYDSTNPEHIAPEDARSIVQQVPLGAYTLVVYSN